MAALRPSLRGDRFDVDTSGILDEDDSHEAHAASPSVAPLNPLAAVKDVLERAPSKSVSAPAPPAGPVTSTGFPEHGRRARVSRFRSQKGAAGAQTGASAAKPSISATLRDGIKQANIDDVEGDDGIGSENLRRIDAMSEDEIRQEQDELRRTLDPDVLRFLSKRYAERPAPIDRASDEASKQSRPGPDEKLESTQPRPRVTFDETPSVIPGPLPPGDTAACDEVDRPTPYATSTNPPPRGQLDEESESFLDDLHAKYFPSLPSEPEKLAWMRTGSGSAYSPDVDTVQLSEIRFDFQGMTISPKSAARVSVAKGLHHHADAPESAGYTIAELARLARSAVPMQRCLAYQTLGRIMFRLGSGAYGPRDQKVPKAIHRMMRECQILETLHEELDRKPVHLSAKNYATEALWLWNRAGGSEYPAE